MKKILGLPIFAALILLMVIPLSPLPIANAATITVPTDFPNIQAAIDAASPGDTVKVLPGTYTEQITISKSLTLTGLGAKSTIINAPAVLDTNVLGLTYIVQVNNGAEVSMKGFTINGGTTCDVFFGATVLDSATLKLDSAAITGCTQVGVLVGSLLAGTGDATITKTNINGYQDIGIAVRNPDATLTVSYSKIIGDENSPIDGQTGISVFFGKGNIHHNKVSGNLCNNPACGSDFLTQFQAFGIIAFDATGSVITHNDVFNNDIGIGVGGNSGCCKVDRNKLTDNRFFGIEVDGGNHTVSYTKISGGNVGVLADALFADTTATLDHVKITGATTPTQELECCGFTAEIITIPPNSFQTAEVKSAQQSAEVQEFVKKKFGEIEDFSGSSSAVSPF